MTGYIPGVPVVEPAPLGRILPENPVFNEAFWVAAAEGAIRDYCGWHVAPVKTQTWSLDGQGASRVLLQTKRLLRVESVLADGRDITARVRASESGVIELRGGSFPCGLGSLVVTAEHGFYPNEVPSLMALIASVASRFSEMFGNVVAQQSAGGSSVTYISSAENLLAGDRAKLDAYRVRGRS